jgi:hypothetical protein
MIAESDSISKAELFTSSWQFTKLSYYIVDMLFHSKPFIGLKFLLATDWFASKSTAKSF